MSGEPTTEHYFEAHITIDPVEADDLEVRVIAGSLGFRIAELLMKKTLDPSKLDTFMTAKSKHFTDIDSRTKRAVSLLQSNGYNVRRYKIENILVDERLARV